MSWNEIEPTEAEKIAAWKKRFDEAFLPLEIQSDTVDRARAFEAAVPGINQILEDEFNRVAPPGSPILKQGLHVPDFYSPAVKAKLALAEEAADAVPVNEEYDDLIGRALNLADDVMEAIVERRLCGAEYEFIINYAGNYSDKHVDDGLSATAHVISSTTEVAYRNFLKMQPVTRPSPGGKLVS